MGKNLEKIVDEIYEDDFSFCTKEMWDNLLSLCEDEEDYDVFRKYKLKEYTKMGGSYNIDFTDFLIVLNKLSQKHVHQDIIFESFPPQCRDYVNLIYAICYKNRLLEYGTCLQCAWISDLGRDCLDPTFSNTFADFIEIQ